MTTVYQAIVNAADHIERNPAAFDFMSVGIPDCDTPGCALGWIGSFGGLTKSACGFSDAATDLLRLEPEPLDGGGITRSNDFTFYNRMDALCGNKVWRKAAHVCAATLRKYAEKYHAPAKRDLIPASVREIFDHTYTAKDLTV